MTEDIEYQDRLTKEIIFTMRQLRFLEEKYQGNLPMRVRTNLRLLLRGMVIFFSIFCVAALLYFSYHSIKNALSSENHSGINSILKYSPDLWIIISPSVLVSFLGAFVLEWLEKRKAESISKKLEEIRTMNAYLN